MSKPNKYTYLYVLQGNYGHGHGYEDLFATNKADANALREIKATLKTYRENESGDYRIVSRRTLNEVA